MKYLSKLWKKPTEEANAIQKERIKKWRKEGTIKRVKRPTRLDRAHSLGYKSKQGFAIIRVRVHKGKRKRPKPVGGRMPKKSGRYFSMDVSKQFVAEQKAGTKYKNMEVLNSYYVGEDGNYKWFECILVDPNHPAIKKDKEIKWITSNKHKGRVFRGLTSSGKSARGLRKNGKGTEKVR